METVSPAVLSGKTDPSALSAMFGSALPYRPPRNQFAAYVWRKRMLLETTTGVVTLEPWEKLLILLLALISSTYVLSRMVIALTPIILVICGHICTAIAFAQWALTYPGLFVRIPDAVKVEVQEVVGNASRAF